MANRSLTNPFSSSRPHPGGGGVEVRCHGFGPHPALRVHGRVHHRDGRRLCRETHRAQHAVEAPATQERYRDRRDTLEMHREKELMIVGLVHDAFAVFLPQTDTVCVGFFKETAVKRQIQAS